MTGAKLGESSIQQGLPINSKYGDDRSSAWNRSNDPLSTPPVEGSSPSKFKASQVLKEKFGQLGLKNTYV